MLNHYRFYRSTERSYHIKRFGMHSLLAFFSTRVVRGGPRILLQLAACLVVLIVIVKIAPGGLLGSLYSSDNFLEWSPHKALEAVGGQVQTIVPDGLAQLAEPTTIVLGDDQPVETGAAAGGLRVVVFGENDVASPTRSPGYRAARRPSWTELLCHELLCSSHLSFTPNLQKSRSSPVASHGLHKAAIKVLLRESAKDSAAGDSPGKDYSFYPDKYPMDKTLPDLARQVQSFLAMDKPSTPPSETIWVFTIGTWDIWTLAAMPTSISRPLVGLLVTHLFDQVEMVYQHSLSKDSIAFSDGNAPSQNNTTTKQSDTTTRTSFKIFIPTLFDPSLAPGWRHNRPQIPNVHSQAEQQRNAVKLAGEWNDQIEIQMGEWIETRDPKPRSYAVKLSAPSSADSPLDHQSLSRRPLRDGYLYDMSGYIVDTMLNNQMHEWGVEDQNGLGVLPREDGIRDVKTPCVSGVGNGSGADGGSACKDPDARLFYSPFELGTKAIATIARQASGMVVRGETVRAAWAAEGI